MSHLPKTKSALALLLAAISAACLPPVAAARPGDARPGAGAEEAPDAATERLVGLRTHELAALRPHMRNGPAALVEFTHHPDALPAVNVGVHVAAPVERVLQAIARPERYPGFVGTVDEVEVVSRSEHTIVYDWSWSMAVFRMHGRNVMRIYRPRPGSEHRGARVTVDNQSGDMGTGRTVMRLLPEPDGGCLLVISMRLDLREANYVARQLSQAARSINRTANMALTYALLLGLRAEAQGGARATAEAPKALEPPSFDRARLEPLLRRGDVVLLDLWGRAAGRVTVLGRIHRGADVVREVMLDAEAFGQALIPGSGATVVSRDDRRTLFDWEIGLPLVGVSGRMRLEHDDPGSVSIHAVDGALDGGQWHFQTEARGHRRSFVWGWAHFDLRRTSFLIRQLVDADPDLGRGIEAASEIMLIRALRTRSAKLPPSKSELHRRAHARLRR